MTVQDILDAAAQLTPQEKLEVAVKLLESLRTRTSIQVDESLSSESLVSPLLQWEGDFLVYQGQVPKDLDIVAAIRNTREERSY